MLTREQIEEIQGDAREKGISIKAQLKESKHSRKYVRHIKFDCNLHQCDAGCSLFMGV